MQASTSTEAAETPDRILDAAEQLFTELGYAGTSMRAIATEAGVNLAAINYHFRSKQGLIQAVFSRRIDPINHRRLELLTAAENKVSERTLTTRAILTAFFEPVRALAEEANVPGIIARLYSEPEDLTRPILQRTFGEVAARFQAALLQAQPGIDPQDLRWRFHFMIGAMIHLLQFNAPLGSESSRENFIEGMDHLMDYAEAGLEQSERRIS